VLFRSACLGRGIAKYARIEVDAICLLFLGLLATLFLFSLPLFRLIGTSESVSKLDIRALNNIAHLKLKVSHFPGKTDIFDCLTFPAPLFSAGDGEGKQIDADYLPLF